MAAGTDIVRIKAKDLRPSMRLRRNTSRGDGFVLVLKVGRATRPSPSLAYVYKVRVRTDLADELDLILPAESTLQVILSEPAS